jgi:hypothetical protein
MGLTTLPQSSADCFESHIFSLTKALGPVQAYPGIDLHSEDSSVIFLR